MEKKQRNWYPGINRKSIDHKNQNQKQEASKINNYIDCKLNRILANDIEKQLRKNKWRYETDYPIFKVFHFSYQPQSSGSLIAKIVYEVPQLLFYNLATPISLSNCLYILKTVFMACEKLTEQFGYFKLSTKMIGITQNFLCKIWVNQQIQKNYIMFKAQDEEEMVQSIIDLIQNVLIRGQLQTKFLDEIQNEKYTIVKMSQFIWKFSYQNNILIPPFYEIVSSKSRMKKPIHKKVYSNISNFQKNNFNNQKSIQQSNQFMSQHRFSEYQLGTNQSKPMNKNISLYPLCFKQRTMLKLNKSSEVEGGKFYSGALTTRTRQNSKSDFIKRNAQRRKSCCSTEKQNDTKTSSKKIPQTIKTCKREDVYLQKRKIEDNKEKMKNMIKQKLKFNREKKRVVKLQAINTVKSIGQFTQSQKKILQESSHNPNADLETLHKMGRKIQNSYFYIETRKLLNTSQEEQQDN